MKPEKIFYFSSTHWDREWYRTVDEYRFRLVRVMDKVIKTLETNPDFEIFTLDGQTSPLGDYLTVRGEQKEALIRLTKSGKLVLGPWYTMPDEFLISGESMVQNLLKGHEIAKKFQAETLKSGYLCDCFGHVANLPQILQGFGIDNVVISRGTNDSELECFFRWQSPDGAQVAAFKAPEICGYGSFYWEAIAPFGPDYTAHLDEITANAVDYVNRELTRTTLPYVILMDGMDHQYIHEFMPEVLRRLEKHFGCPVVQERLDHVFREIDGSMPEVMGELCAHSKENVMHNKLIPHTLSSRYDLKRANDDCQNALERYAMPSAAVDVMTGEDPIFSFLTYAYDLLLQNHAHDSICGCSIAAVHREMHTRFEKCRNTADTFFLQFCERENRRSVSPDGDVLVKVFNPLPYTYRGLLELDIDFPQDFPVRELPYVKYEQRNAFHVYNESGEQLPYNLIRAFRGNFIRVADGGNLPADTHRVALIGELRPMGFTTFRVVPAEKPCRILDRFSTGTVSCENQWIRFRVNSDGTVQITDKETGEVYDHLHSFLDCGEVGDGWFHIRPIQDRMISSLGCPVSVEKVFDGYAACKFRVIYRMQLPKQPVQDHDFLTRSQEYTEVTIASEFTVSRTSKLVTVETVVDNTAMGHRLQLHLPTRVQTEQYHVNQCDLMLTRKCGMDVSHFDWKEADISEYSFENMAWIREGNRGLLFLSGGGLHEISCLADEENSMDITLLRCFSKTVGTDGEPDGEMLGKQMFRYALCPISGETDRELVVMKDQFVSAPRCFTVPKGALTEEESAFTLRSQGSAYVTAMPSKDQGILLRLVNYTAEEDRCAFTFAKPVSSACLCNFLEEPCGEGEIQGNTVRFSVPPYKIATVHVTF